MKNTELKTVFIRMPNWLGDVIMALPAVESLREKYPKIKIILGTLKKNRQILETALISNFVIAEINKNSIRVNSKIIRRHKADAAILFTNSFSSALEVFLARIKMRIGYTLDGRSLLLTERIKAEREIDRPHQILYYKNLLSALSINDTEISAPSISAPDINPDFLERAGWNPRTTTIGINPGAAYGSAKRWLPEYFREVAEHFTGLGAQVLVFGASEQEIVNAGKISDNISGVINLAGKTSLPELLYAINMCDIFITNDSGPMHIAAALGKNVVAIFGPTNLKQTAPVTKNSRVCSSNEPCSPCMERECPLKHHNCMKNVKPVEVIKAAESFLKE